MNNNKNEADDNFKVKVRVGYKTRGAPADEFAAAAAARKSEHSFPPFWKKRPVEKKKKTMCENNHQRYDTRACKHKNTHAQ